MAPKRGKRTRRAFLSREERDRVQPCATEDLARRFDVGKSIGRTSLCKAQSRASPQHLGTDGERGDIAAVEIELLQKRLRGRRRAAIDQHLDEKEREHHNHRRAPRRVAVQLEHLAAVALGARQIAAQCPNGLARPQRVAYGAWRASLPPEQAPA